METPIYELKCNIRSSVDLDFSDSGFVGTMREIEKAHWDYLDNMCQKYHLPRLNFYVFMRKIFEYYGKDHEV